MSVRGLSRDLVLDAALELADRDGLGALSMRGVAARLEVTPMALYRHVGDKQGLLDGVVERLLWQMPVPGADLPWVQRLAAFGTGLRAVAARHPEAFLLLLSRPVVTPAARARREAVYAALRDGGVAPALIARVERLISTFALGLAASEAGGRFAAHEPGTLDADLRWLQERALALLGGGSG